MAEAQTDQKHEQILAGVKVLDLSRVLAGPWCTQMLGDFGADVIKVEAVGKGDDSRAWGPPFLPRPEGDESQSLESAYFLCANRNKRSIAIDISKPDGAALIRRLCEKADVFVENFKVGGLKKYGLDYASLRDAHPHLVYCSITGFGQNGPYAQRGGYDYVAQAMGGFMSINGQLGGEPMKAGVAICDLFTGMYAATATLAALHHAKNTGQGQYIDCALLDTQVAMLANQAMSYLVAGIVGRPLGNGHPTVVPYTTFETLDGKAVVAIGNDGQFRTACRVLGAEALASDPRFATNANRIHNRAAIEAEITARTRTFATADLVAALAAEGVPAGPINTVDKVFDDPQVKIRDVVHRFTRADGVEIPTVGYPPKLSETPAEYRLPPPRVGEHSREILTDWLGLDVAEQDKLFGKGIVG
jgi:crotonobetainyl-CoA:carnitine CoA-transferase CaiB-like acyl-CoA transferase